VQIIGAYLIGI